MSESLAAVDLTDDPELGEQATHMLKQFQARQRTRRS
jgi:hypothetical protein